MVFKKNGSQKQLENKIKAKLKLGELKIKCLKLLIGLHINIITFDRTPGGGSRGGGISF